MDITKSVRRHRAIIDDDVAEDLLKREQIRMDSMGRVFGISDFLRRQGWGKK